MATEQDPETGTKHIERVILACVQCRSRHVRCDATQPVCNRCKRDGKECNYQKSRRGGLDKAALARRKLRLQQEAERKQAQQAESSKTQSPLDFDQTLLSRSSLNNNQLISDAFINDTTTLNNAEFQFINTNTVSFQVDPDRLLELFYENFWSGFPAVLPLHFLLQRRMNDDHGMDELLLVLQWIGSIYAPWTSANSYYEAAFQALQSPILAHTPFVVQALMMFSIAQYHSALKSEGQTSLNLAVKMAIELRMNQKGFARAYGEGNPVLEESWRRTFYLLVVADQHFAIIANSPIYALFKIPNLVDLPCDDEYYESGHIPPLSTWQEYQEREFAEVEVIYSSIVYLYDMAKVVSHVMDMFLATGTFGDAMIDHCDTRLAIWLSMLPTMKREPLRTDGRVDQVMFTAHMIYAITINTMHRPYSSLTLAPEEMTTTSFLSPTPFVVPPQTGRGAHTARTLKAIELSTKLLAIPGSVEKHSVITMCMCAQLATAQVSACVHLLDDRALSIARDRVRLSISFLNEMGSFWPLGKMMAREVRNIARIYLTNTQTTISTEPPPDPAMEIEMPRDELIWPIDPSAQIDIYSGIVMPAWEATELPPGLDYSSSTTSSISFER